MNSNATPIKNRHDQGYSCFFCPQKYPEPADLKLHTIQDHDEETLKKFITDLRLYTVKLDITGLQCTICDSEISTLEGLMEHLMKSHERTIHTDIKNQLIPFKFEGDNLDCALCSTKCSTFKNLTNHMNVHYSNFECSACGAGFINNDVLRCHERIHKTGTFQCDLCPKTFDTLVRKRTHINVTHKKSSRNHKCGYCDELFNDYHKKNLHLNEIHGEKLLTYKCDVCNRTFRKHTLLKNHMRKIHFMERDVLCDFCDMRFFARKDLVRHMVKHTGVRNYRCDLCGKAFGRSFTLKQHMKVHTKERRKEKNVPLKYLVTHIMDSDSETQ